MSDSNKSISGASVDKSVQVKLVLLGENFVGPQLSLRILSLSNARGAGLYSYLSLSTSLLSANWGTNALLLTGEAAVGKSSIVLRFVSIAILSVQVWG